MLTVLSIIKSVLTLYFHTLVLISDHHLTPKIGACRHGDRCSRKHIKPPFSQTILLPNVYHNPAHDPVCKLTDRELQEGFDAVYEDLYCELSKFGHLLELHVSQVTCHKLKHR